MHFLVPVSASAFITACADAAPHTAVFRVLLAAARTFRTCICAMCSTIDNSTLRPPLHMLVSLVHQHHTANECHSPMAQFVSVCMSSCPPSTMPAAEPLPPSDMASSMVSSTECSMAEPLPPCHIPGVTRQLMHSTAESWRCSHLPPCAHVELDASAVAQDVLFRMFYTGPDGHRAALSTDAAAKIAYPPISREQLDPFFLAVVRRGCDSTAVANKCAKFAAEVIMWLGSRSDVDAMHPSATHCRFFARGVCRNGDQCRFLHASVQENHSPPQQHAAVACLLNSIALENAACSGAL